MHVFMPELALCGVTGLSTPTPFPPFSGKITSRLFWTVWTGTACFTLLLIFDRCSGKTRVRSAWSHSHCLPMTLHCTVYTPPWHIVLLPSFPSVQYITFHLPFHCPYWDSGSYIYPRSSVVAAILWPLHRTDLWVWFLLLFLSEPLEKLSLIILSLILPMRYFSIVNLVYFHCILECMFICCSKVLITFLF